MSISCSSDEPDVVHHSDGSCVSRRGRDQSDDILPLVDQHVLIDTGTVVVKGEQIEPTLKPREVRQLWKAVERMRSVMAEYPSTAPVLGQPVRHLLEIIKKAGAPSREMDARRLAMREQGKSYDEIATATGNVSKGTVKTSLARGRRARRGLA